MKRNTNKQTTPTKSKKETEDTGGVDAMPMSTPDAVFVEPAASSTSSSSGANSSRVVPGAPPPPHIVIDGSGQAQLQRIMQRRMSISTRQILSASQVNAAGGSALAAGGGGVSGTGSASHELINPQIYKIVTTDGTTSNVIIDTSSASAPPHNSKLLLSNLTVLSKQGPASSAVPVVGTGQPTHQQFNYVSAKNLPFVTATAAPGGKQQQQQKFTSGSQMTAYKAAGKPLTAASYVQQPSSAGTTTPLLQKVTLGSRMVTRLQSYVHPPIQAQQQAQTPQIIVQPTTQQKYVRPQVTTAATSTAAKKQQQPTQKITVKSVGNSLQQQQQQLQAQHLKTFIAQQQQQQQQKTQRYSRQVTGLCADTSPTIQGLPGHGNTEQQAHTITLQQQKMQPSAAIKTKFVKQGTSVGGGVTTALSIASVPQSGSNAYGKHQQIGQQPATLAATKVTKLGSSKYMLQQQQPIQQLAATLPQGTQLQHKTTTTSATGGQQQGGGGSAFIMQQSPGISATTGVGGTIKFVNSHGTVIQPHQPAAAKRVHYNSTSSDGGDHQQSPASSLITDDVMIVNGTQMTDEFSARILQSMAQKSFSQQQQRYQTQHTTMPPPAPQSTPTQIVYSGAGAGSGAASASGATNLLLTHHHHFQGQQVSMSTAPATSSYLTVTAAPSASTASVTLANTPSVSISSHGFASGSAAISSYMSATAARRQSVSAPSSRSASLDRKLQHEMTRKTPTVEFYKQHSSVTNTTSNNSNSNTPANSSSLTNLSNLRTSSSAVVAVSSAPASTITTHNNNNNNNSNNNSNNVHLSPIGVAAVQVEQATTLKVNATQQQQHNHHHQHQHQYLPSNHDEELYIEEVRPVPVQTQDLRLQQLHAILQDHTYASQQQQHQQQQQSVVGSSQQQQTAAPSQQWSLGGIGVTVAGAGTPTSPCFSPYFGQQISRQAQDDDAHSAISTGSRLASGDIDPGEETETAPEAEAEDDSVTRCICDLTHDDGYMICCDKCSAWQHVDCMGIDRLNIPDEYLCELCQPRAVDKARARILQRQKRKEQMILVANQAANGLAVAQGAAVNGALHLNSDLFQQQRLGSVASGINGIYPSGASGVGGMGKKAVGKVHKKSKEATTSVSGSVAGSGGKKTKKSGCGDKAATASKSTKKTTKRKTKSSGESGSSPALTAAEKHAANLRQWIENYEYAVTNHYAPELRARLHAIQKQPSLLQSIQNTENKALRQLGGNGSELERRAQLIPYAGAKILISSVELAPHSPIHELRGKYMLTTQFRTQNPTINMNTPPPSNYLNSFKAHKTPGQFVFFYQLPGVEAPMQTLRADGSVPAAPPQPPAYLKGPEVCVDTRTYGNDARFVRRSCRPNAELQHYFEKGTLHLYIVALTQIRAQTEITVRHEPHDLAAVEQKKSHAAVVQPTSTRCACDLGSDCLFALPLAIQQQLQTPTAQPRSSHRNKAANAASEASSAAAIQLTMGLQQPLQGPANRNRSTSSSGESSTMGLNSPQLTQLNLGFKAAAPVSAAVAAASSSNNSMLPVLCSSNSLSNTSSSVSSVVHDSGICTSSSSPSVSIPSPTPTTQLQSPTASQQQQQTSLLHRSPTNNNHVNVTQAVEQKQQILATLPTPMLLSPQQPQQHLQQHQQKQQGQQLQATVEQQQPLAVMAAAAAAQRPMAMSPEQQLRAQSYYLQQQQQQQQQTHLEQQKKQFLLQQQQMEDEARMAVSALQSLHATTPLCQPQQQQEQQQPQEQQQEQQLQITTSQVQQVQQHSPPQPSPTPVIFQSQAPSATPVKPPQMIPTTSPAALNTSTTLVTPIRKNTTPAKPASASDSHKDGEEDSSAAATPTPTPTKEKPKAKQSREDRKLEAILRAIEKMEKQEARCKKDTRQTKRQASNSPASPTKRNSSNSISEDHVDGSSQAQNQVTQTSSAASRRNKKKRKATRSTSSNSAASQRKRRKSMMLSTAEMAESDGESHALTTSESEATSIHSPSPPQLVTSATAQSQTDQAAGLLLALAHNNVETDKYPRAFKSPPSQQTALVSSACLLIEAAMGPLEPSHTSPSPNQSGGPEFKYPGNGGAKTKKMLMSNWFQQAEQSLEHSGPSPTSGLDSLVQAAMSEISVQEQQQRVNATTSLTFAEQFIHQAESTPASAISNVPREQLQLPLQNNSSVKKRWLRQAISEETTDDSGQNTPGSASSTPLSLTPQTPNAQQPPLLPNGFSTPLKKRRLVVVNNKDATEEAETVAEEAHIDVEDEKTPKMKEEEVEGEVVAQETGGNLKLETTTHNNILDQDDDVDILRSPSPGAQQIMAEDNLVKIEPEDTSAAADDVKIDVEREESQACDKFEELLKVKQETGPGVSSSSPAVQVKAEPKVEAKPETVIKIEKKAHLQPVTTSYKAKAETMDHPHEPKPGESLLRTATIKPLAQSTSSTTAISSQQALVDSVKAAIKSRSGGGSVQEVKVESLSLLNNLTPEEPAKKKLKTEASTSTVEPKTTLAPPATTAATPTASATSVMTGGEATGAVNKNLTEHDLQERLLSFHAANISYLQSRNKKASSKGSTTPPAILPSANKNSSSAPPLAVISPGKSKNETKEGRDRTKEKLLKKSKKEKKKSKEKGKQKPSDESPSKPKKQTKETKDKEAKTATSATLPPLPAPSAATNGKAMKHCNNSSNNNNNASESNTTLLRRRTMSMCVSGPAVVATPPATLTTTKKRQTNFEQELTKPNSQILSSSLINNASGAHKVQASAHPPASAPHHQHHNHHHHNHNHIQQPPHQQQHRKENNHRLEDNNSGSLAAAIASGKLTAITRRRESMCGSRQQAAIVAAIKKEKKEKKKSKKKERERLKEKEKSLAPKSAKATATAPLVMSHNQGVAPKVAVATPKMPQPPSFAQQQPLKAVTPPTSAAPIPVLITQSPQPLMAAKMAPIPFYNTIYGKLQDRPGTAAVEQQTSSSSTPINTATSNQVTTLGKMSSMPSLAEYLEATKSRSSVAPVTPPTPTTPTILTPSLVAAPKTPTTPTVSTVDMPPPPTTTPLKLYTRTASHDPRLNPMLTVPEPTPMPKRKLSISEYRMRHRPSVDTAPSPTTSTPTTPTTSAPSTPPGSMDRFVKPRAQVGQTINRCSLQSPERFQQGIRERRNSMSVHNNHHQASSSSPSPNSSAASLKSASPNAAATLSTVNSILSTAHKLHMFDDKPKGGHFNAAPTLLEQQQEKMSERSRCLQRTISCDSRVIERFGTGAAVVDKTITTTARRDGA